MACGVDQAAEKRKEEEEEDTVMADAPREAAARAVARQ